MDELRSRLGGGLAPHLPASLHSSQIETKSGLVHTRTGRYLPGRSGMATQRCLKYSPTQFVRAQVGVSSLAATSQCCSSCATPMRSGPWWHTAARQTFPSVGPREFFSFTVGVDGTQSVVEHVDRRSAASAGMRLPSWRGSSLQSCRTKYLAASSVDRGVGQEIEVWQHNIRSQSRRLPYERCRSVPPGRQVAELSRLETAPD